MWKKLGIKSIGSILQTKQNIGPNQSPEGGYHSKEG